jgi:AhpD family alkylhydroperoxidase
MKQQQNASRQEIEGQIEDTFGFVPKFYQSVPESALNAGWRLHRDLELPEDTALDNKTKELVGLSVASHIKCQYCTHFHSRTSEAFGANDQEIREAIAMGGLTDFWSNCLSGTQQDFSTFQKDVNKMIEALS